MTIDAETLAITMAVSDEDLAARRARWQAPPLKYVEWMISSFHTTRFLFDSFPHIASPVTHLNILNIYPEQVHARHHAPVHQNRVVGQARLRHGRVGTAHMWEAGGGSCWGRRAGVVCERRRSLRRARA